MTEGCQEHRVMTTAEWQSAHGVHGEPTKVPNEHQPPKGTYRLYTLICPCRARHVLMEKGETP